MTHRIHRTPQGLSVTSPIRVGLLTSAFTAALLALATPNTAWADPETRCRSLTGGGYTCETIAPTTTTVPARTGSHGNGPEWMKGLPDIGFAFFLGLAIAVIGGIVWAYTAVKTPEGRAAHGPAAGAARAEAGSERAVGAFMVGAGVILCGWGAFGIGGALLSAVIGVPIMLVGIKRSEHADMAKSGYTAADQAWQHDAEMARLNAEMARPNPAEYDPLGLGIAPPPAPAPVIPAEPRMDDADAVRWHRHGGHVDLIPGSAAAALVARDGSWTAGESAWIEACKAARLGNVEQRQSRVPGVNSVSDVFVPGADLARVEVLETGDAALVVRPRSLAVGAPELAAVTPFLLRTARVRHAGGWVRAHATDEYVITLSNRDLTTAQEQTSAPAPTTGSDDDEDW